jgi:hypothetical protein
MPSSLGCKNTISRICRFSEKPTVSHFSFYGLREFKNSRRQIGLFAAIGRIRLDLQHEFGDAIPEFRRFASARVAVDLV